MKTWTVVLEIHDDTELNQAEIEAMVSTGMEQGLLATCGFRIMETIEAPYGPGGMSLSEFPNMPEMFHHPGTEPKGHPVSECKARGCK